MSTPKQRHHGLTTRTAGKDVLVHDAVTDEVHCLTGELVEVWQTLRLGLTEPELAVATKTDPARLTELLAELQTAGLLAERKDGVDRRALLQRAGIVGAGAVAFPLLTTVVAPRAFAAASNPAPLNTPASAGQTLPAGALFTVVMIGGGGGGGVGPNATAGGAGARYQVTGVVGASAVTITALTPGSGGSPDGTGGGGAATGGAGAFFVEGGGGGGGASSLTLGGVVVAIAGGGGGGTAGTSSSVTTAPTAGATPTTASATAIAAMQGKSQNVQGGGGGAGSTAGKAGTPSAAATAGGSAYYESGVIFGTPVNVSTTYGAGGSVGQFGGDGLVSLTRTT